MTWTVDSSGSQTAVIGTEHMLATPTTNATYEFCVDTVNMTWGDVLELRVYDKIDGTNYRQVWKGSFSNPQLNVGICSPPKPITTQAQFSLKQTAGTGRVFPWIVRRI